jgi:hypothetical protein
MTWPRRFVYLLVASAFVALAVILRGTDLGLAVMVIPAIVFSIDYLVAQRASNC